MRMRDYGDQEDLESIPSRSFVKWYFLFGLFLVAVVAALVAGRLVGNRSDPALTRLLPRLGRAHRPTPPPRPARQLTGLERARVASCQPPRSHRR